MNNIRHASFGKKKNPRELLQQLLEMQDLEEVVVVYAVKGQNVRCDWSTTTYANLCFSKDLLANDIQQAIFQND